MEMKKRCKSVQAIFLSFVVFMSSLVIVPPMETQAEFKGAITSNMDNEGVLSYYWCGEEFELYFTSNGTVTDSSISITKDGVDASDQFENISISSSESDGAYKDYTVKVKVADVAEEGKYTFTVNDGKNQSSKEINVYTEDVLQIAPVLAEQANMFYNNTSKTFTETFLYSSVAYNKLSEEQKSNPLSFVLNEDVKEDLAITVSEPDFLTYKGCVAYSVTFKPLREVDENGEPAISLEENSRKAVVLTISYVNKELQNETQEINYYMLQTSLGLESFELVECTNAANYGLGAKDETYLTNYPHVDSATKTIYIDADETIYLKTEIKGSTRDTISFINFGDFEGYLNFDDNKTGEKDAYGCLTNTGLVVSENNIYIKLTARKTATSASSPLSLVLSTASGKSLEYKVHIYGTYVDINHLQAMQITVNNKAETIENFGGIHLTWDPYLSECKYKFSTQNFDTKEKIVWKVTDTSIGAFSGGEPLENTKPDNNLIFMETQDPYLTIKSEGEVIVTAESYKTLTRPQRIFSTIASVNLKELVLPEQGSFKIVYNGQEMSGDTLQVGSSKTYELSGEGNYQNYSWVSTNQNVATVDANGKVTAKAQGVTQIYAITNYPDEYGKANVKSNELTIKVFSPITTLSLKDEDGIAWGTEKEVIGGRTYTIVGDKGSSNETIAWNLPSTEYAYILKGDGSKATASEWVEGDKCTLVVRAVSETGASNNMVTLQCKPKVTTQISAQSVLTIVPELLAEKVLIDYAETSIREEVGAAPILLNTIQYSDYANRIFANEELEWTTSNEAVANITPSINGDNAEITLVGTGEAIITCKTKKSGVSAQIKITAIKKATGISYTSTNLNLGVFSIGDEETFTATMNPITATEKVEWCVNPEESVVITEIENGIVKITASENAIPGEVVEIWAKTADSEKTSTKYRFTIKQSINNCDISLDKTQYSYTGSYINPVETITCGGLQLEKNKDYDIRYENNREVGTAKMTITGRGNYAGTKIIEFPIVKANLSQAQISINNKCIYNGKEQMPSPTVKMGTTWLSKDRDYTVTYVNNTNAGVATVKVTGIGNYTGTATTTFTIEGSTSFSISLVNSRFEYSGELITPEITVKDGTKVLTNGTDYTVVYSDNIEPGTATVKVTGVGNYSGEKSYTYTISTKNLTLDMVKLNKTDFVYNGKACKPKVTIKHPETGKKLKANTDYTVTYPTDMINKGVKRITITGKGNYSGSIYVEYGVAEKITLKKPSIKKAKNSKKKTVAFEVKKVANAEGYEVYYSTSKKFTEDTTEMIDITKNKTNIKKLKKGTYYFKVRAYKKNSIGRTIYSSMSKVKKVKVKK